MDWELDHVFLACSDIDAAKRAMADFGFVLNEGRIHRGQGTANFYAYFQNAFFELLFPVDYDELNSETVRPLGLKERIEWQTTGACPFGVCLRPVADLVDTPELPVKCWSYVADYMPPETSIPIVTPPGALYEPLVFISSGRYQLPRGAMTAHRGKERTLIKAQIHHPAEHPPSAGVRWFAENSPLSLAPGAEYELELVWDDGNTGRGKIASLPLSVSW